jgi:hypothetical protein
MLLLRRAFVWGLPAIVAIVSLFLIRAWVVQVYSPVTWCVNLQDHNT